MPDGDAGSMTDANWTDTDVDGIIDGIEDADVDGVWDFTGNPFTGGGTGESNPLDLDSDHGDVDDFADGASPVDPLIGDEDIDPQDDGTGGYTPATNTFFIGPVSPGDSNTGSFNIVEMDSIALDSLYIEITDLDWVRDTIGYPAPVWATDVCLLEYTNITVLSPMGQFDLGVSGTQNIEIQVNVPWGQMPGIYQGRIVVRDDEPFFGNPVDTIIFEVMVEVMFEADILNNDLLPDGVGFSDQDSTGALDNEMHLVSPVTALITDTIIGTFWVSNPNTEPDTNFDFINDINTLPALPRYSREPWGPGGTPSFFYQDEWDVTDLYGNPDRQGNTVLRDVFVTYQFIDYIGAYAVDPDTVESRVFIHFDRTTPPFTQQGNKIHIDSLDIGECGSMEVKIHTWHLPPGTYLGWVYLWKDIDGNALYDGGSATFTTPSGAYSFSANCSTIPAEQGAMDAFLLRFRVMAPDIDIVQGEENIDADNVMNLQVAPGDTSFGIFTVANPNASQNLTADPWDGPSTENADSVGVYDPDTDIIHLFPHSMWLYREGTPTDSIPVIVDGDTFLALGDWKNVYTVRAMPGADVLEGVYTTKYTTLNPVTTDPLDDFYGKLLLSARGVYTDAAYDATEPFSYQIMDWFDLRVTVGAVEAITVIPDVDVDSVDHGAFVIDSFRVANTGNADLYGIVFDPTSLQDGLGNIIHPDNIIFDPPQITTLLIGDTAVVTKEIIAPAGQYTGWYTGEITVKDDDGVPSDIILCSLYVRADYDLDIADNAQNLVGNMMSLVGDTGSVVAGTFVLVNPNSDAQNADPDPFGNADLDLSGATAYVSTDLIFGIYTIPSTAILFLGAPDTLVSGGFANVGVSVTIPGGQEEGTYTGTVTVTSADGSTDNFTLNVTVGPAESIILTGILDKTVDHGVTAIDTFTVENNGNADIDNIVFEVTDLADGTGRFIASSYITFNPTSIGMLGMGLSQDVEVFVAVPFGTYNTTYTGIVTVKDDDGFPLETIAISITVSPSYDLDIADNAQNLVGNMMSLVGDTGSVVAGTFVLVNPNSEAQNVDPDPFGNADLDLSGPTAYVSTDLIFGIYTIPSTAILFLGAPDTLVSGGFANVGVSVTIPGGQEEGTYTGTVTVTSADGSTDNFTLNVTVGPAESIILTGILDKTVDHGVTAIDTFTVENNGNADIDNIVFEVTDLADGTGRFIASSYITFNPTSIGMLGMGLSQDVEVFVEVPSGTYNTTYTGTVRVKDDDGSPLETIAISITVNPSYDLDIADNWGGISGNTMGFSLETGTAGSEIFYIINPNSEGTNTDPDPFGNAELTQIQYEIDTLWHTTPLYYIPSGDLSISGITGALLPGASEEPVLTVNIPVGQEEGVYTGWVRIWDAGTLVVDSFEIIVQVGPAEDINIVEAVTSGSGDHGMDVVLTAFSIENTGNADLDMLQFQTSGLESGPYSISPDDISIYVTNFWAPVNDAILDHLPRGESATAQPKVTVKRGQHAGTYTGFIRVIDNDGVPSDVIEVSLEVLPSYDLDIVDNTQNLVGNTLSLSGGIGDVLEGLFRVINPNSPATNFDPDPFGNADITTFSYISDTLLFVDETVKGTKGFGIDDEYSFGVRKGLKIGEIIPAEYVTVTLPAFIASGSGEDVAISVEIPQDIRTGTYEGWVRFTGEGVTTDSFKLQVKVKATEDLDIVEGSVTIVNEVGHGSTAQTPEFTIVNTDLANNPDIEDGPGNVTLHGIHFLADNLFCIYGERFILKENVDFEPTNIASLASGTSVTARAVIHIPTGTYATTYTGLVTAQNGMGSVSDTVRIILTVAEAPFFYISDNEGNLVENTMFLTGDVGDTTDPSQFVLYNPHGVGNVDITGITYTVTGLDQFTVEFDQVEYGVEYGGRTVGELTATIPDGQPQGTYIGWVVLEHPGGVRDSFNLSITVNPDEMVSLSVDTLYITGREGTTARGSFSVLNQGNITLTDLRFEMLTDLEDVGGTLLSRDRVKFTYPVIDTLVMGGSTDIEMSVEIPGFTMAGEYIGTFTVMRDEGLSDKAVVVLTVTSETEVVVDDNPVISDRVNIRVKADAGFEPKLTILNLAGEIVRFEEAFAAPVGKSGVPTRVYEWLLDNEAGKEIASGVYIIVIQTEINGEEKILKDKILVIR